MFVAQTIWRSVTVGLLAACVVLLAQVRNAVPAHDVSYVMVPTAPPSGDVRYLTVAADVADVIPLLDLAPGERVIAVNFTPVITDLAAGAAIERVQHSRTRSFWIYTQQRSICVTRS